MLQTAYYGTYDSLFVLLPFNDAVGGRIFPALQGNGGAASGGPLFTPRAIQGLRTNV